MAEETFGAVPLQTDMVGLGFAAAAAAVVAAAAAVLEELDDLAALSLRVEILASRNLVWR